MIEKKSSGFFWALLLLFGGGAVWAINKYIISPSKNNKDGVKKKDTSNGGNTKIKNGGLDNQKNSGGNTQNTIVKTNEATQNSMPYDLDLSLLTYTVDPKYIPKGQRNSGVYDNKYEVSINTNGGICLFKKDSSNFKTPYLYNSNGKYLSKGSDTPIVIDFTKICSVHFGYPSQQVTPYYHAIFFKITNNYNLAIQTNITCHLELSYNGNIISTIDKDMYGIKNKKYEVPLSIPDRIFQTGKNNNGIYNLSSTLKVKQTGTYFLPFFYDNKNVTTQDAFNDFGTKPKYSGSSVNIKITGYIGIQSPSMSTEYKQINVDQTLSVPLDIGTNDFAFCTDFSPYIKGSVIASTPSGNQKEPIPHFNSSADENFAILDQMESFYCAAGNQPNIPDDFIDEWRAYCNQDNG